VVYDARGRHGAPDFAERLHSCIPDNRLLHRAYRLQRRQQRVRMRRAADIRHKVAELLRDGLQHLVLIVLTVRQKRDELLARALLAQSQGDGLQTTDAVQLQLHVVVLRAREKARQVPL
jgi:hypothetical protein